MSSASTDSPKAPVCVFPGINKDLYPENLYSGVHRMLYQLGLKFSPEQVELLLSLRQFAALADSQFTGVPDESRLRARAKCGTYLANIECSMPPVMIRAFEKNFPHGAKYLRFLFHLLFCIVKILTRTLDTRQKPCCYLATPLPFTRECRVAPYQGMYNESCAYCDIRQRNRLMGDLKYRDGLNPRFHLVSHLLDLCFILRHTMPIDMVLRIISQIPFIVSFQNLMLEWGEHHGFCVQEGTTLIIRGDGQQISAPDLFLKWLTHLVKLLEKHVCNSQGGIQLHVYIFLGKLSHQHECDKPSKLPWRVINSLFPHTVLVSNSIVTVSPLILS